MPASWIRVPGAASERVVLFCHGGGYQIGSIKSHLNLMSRLSAATGGRVLGFEYRLAPEHRFPAAAEDAFAAYRWLLDSGIDPRRIAVAGDSAGAALALGVALQAREAGVGIPACLVLISPWVDLAMRGDSYVSRAPVDVFSKPEQLAAMARTYLGRDGNALDPLASPVEARLDGLPPILIHAGDFDITLDDSKLLARRAREQGVTVELRIWEEMYHHFQVFPELPEAGQSVEQIGDFVRSHLA
ncbi:alpha/beta hydrolase [Microbaculum marinum]|uniref:Alpha/beta hydrolase n=1 Tax=Microbaculum marinum TaxID=1764581 RepID=A0AAW9RUM9_9HYPH